MKIEVTAEDIACGRRRSTGFCPIAIAAKRSTGKHYIVGSNLMWIHDSPQGQNLKLPQEAEMFIKDFDAGDVVHPFTFEISE